MKPNSVESNPSDRSETPTNTKKRRTCLVSSLFASIYLLWEIRIHLLKSAMRAVHTEYSAGDRAM